MENMESIFLFVKIILNLPTVCGAFFIKLIERKARVKEKFMTALLNTATPLVKITKTLLNNSGAEKKVYVPTKRKGHAEENKTESDIKKVSDKIEQRIELSKQTISGNKKEWGLCVAMIVHKKIIATKEKR